MPSKPRPVKAVGRATPAKPAATPKVAAAKVAPRDMGRRRPGRVGKNVIRPPSDEVAALREREWKVVEAVLAGASLEQAAQATGYADKSGAQRALHRALNRQEASAVGEYRALENARYDRIQTVLWPLALGGDLKAVDRLLRLFERRAKLNGLDQPQQFVGAFTAADMPRDPTERAAVLISFRERLAEQIAEADSAATSS